MNFFEDEQIVIKLRFIVFKMTAQITRSTLKKQKSKKVQWGREMKKELSKFGH